MKLLHRGGGGSNLHSIQFTAKITFIESNEKAHG